MFKAKDGTENAAYDVVTERPESVVSGRVVTRGPERAGTLRAPRAAPDAILRGYLPPMLATLVEEAPPGKWRAEVKYDGYRAISALSNGRVAMWTRNALDLSARFPRIARALSQVVVGDAVLDGEICVLDPQGVPRFELIEQGAPTRRCSSSSICCGWTERICARGRWSSAGICSAACSPTRPPSCGWRKRCRATSTRRWSRCASAGWKG